jgi:Tol biopolymer transport system component
MKLQRRNLLGLTTSLALFFGVLTMGARLVAQEAASDQTSSAVSSDLMTEDHDRGPQNGDLAVRAVTVIDGAYGTSQIATVPKDGGPYHFLTTVDTMPNGAYDPDFTPDGMRVFFETFGDDHNPDRIFSVPIDGGPFVQVRTACLTDPNCLGDDAPAVSPNGRELLFVRSSGPIDNNGCVASAVIIRTRLNGTQPKQLTQGGPPCGGDYEPRWSPDGNWIVFQHADPSGVWTLWIMRRDGSRKQQLTAMTDVAKPDWSPDGDRIVFQSPAEPADDQQPEQIYTIRPDGTHLRQITHYAPIIGVTLVTDGAHWSPDGKKLVFAHRDPTTTLGPDGQPHGDLFEMNPDGSDVVQINFTPEKDNDPAWGARSR